MRYISVIVGLMAMASAQAQSSFDGVVAAIVDGNPTLRVTAHEIQSDYLEASGENTLADPSVELARVWGRHSIGNKLQLDVSEEFDWPTAYGARNAAADLRREAATISLRGDQVAVESTARALLVELVYVRQQIQTITELRKSFDKLSDAIDRGVRGGELTVIDQRKMQIETFEVDGELTSARSREQQIIAELQGMTTTSLDLSEITAYPVQPLLTRQEYVERVASEPAVLAQGVSARQAEAEARVASAKRMPGISVGYQHQAEMGDRFNGFTVGLSLPVFSGSQARRAAIERSEAAAIARDAEVGKRTAEIDAAYAELLLQRERIDTYRRVFGDHQYLSLLLKAYEGGQLSVIEYLSEVHYYHQVMLSYLDTEYRYHSALTALNRPVM